MSTTRRDFLKVSLGGAALTSLGTGVRFPWDRLALAAAPEIEARDTVLIVVQLAGGNDGLNTVVPYAHDPYAKSRRTLRLTARQVHKIDAGLGFHPRMEAFKRLYDEGHLAVVQGVAYPGQSQAHPRSMEIWQTAMPEQTHCQTGWLGRVVDAMAEATGPNVPAIFVGGIARPFALNAERAIVPSVRSVRQCTFNTTAATNEGDRPIFAARKSGRPPSYFSADPNPLLDFVARSTAAARTASRKIEQVARASAGRSAYPPFRLAQMFRIVADLVRAEVGIRVFYTELGGSPPGGFDNHANQLGNHGALLHELSESVAALVDDLKRDRLLDRVMLMTFSEFGRTLAENGRRGTGHGEAAPVFLAGGQLKGGLVGSHPSLTDLRKGSPKFHTDFRRVYAAVLDRWLGFDSRAVLGGTFAPLDVFSRSESARPYENASTAPDSPQASSAIG